VNKLEDALEKEPLPFKKRILQDFP